MHSSESSQSVYSPSSLSELSGPTRPRLWIAAVLSLLAPGAGHIYAGARWRSLIALVIKLVAWIATVAVLDQPWNVVGLSLLASILVAVDASMLARRPTAAVPDLKWVALAVVGFFGLAHAAAMPIRAAVFEPFSIPAASMAPTLLPGDLILVDKLAYLGEEPRRGDVVVFLYPDDRDVRYVKRIIGLPGDEVRVRGSQVWLNGIPLERSDLGENPSSDRLGDTRHLIEEHTSDGRSYTVLDESLLDTERSSMTEVAERLWMLPADRYFMLGDNRLNSRDSRRWQNPFVPREDIEGRVVSRYYSYDPDTGLPRLDRIGPIRSPLEPE